MDGIMDTVEVSHDQKTAAVDRNNENSGKSDSTNSLTAHGVKSLRLLKGLMTNDENANIPTYYGLLGLLGQILGCILTSSLTIIPQQNAIARTNYWYEYPIISSLGFGVSIACTHGLMETEYWMNTDVLKNWKSFLSMAFIVSGSYFLWATLGYVIWVTILKLNHPIPFNFFMCGTLSFCSLLALLWFHIPKTYRSDLNFKKKFRYYILVQVTTCSYAWFHVALGLLFGAVSHTYQWILAVILPLIREIQQWGLTELCYKSTQCKDLSVTISVSHAVVARQALFLAIQMASVASTPTSFLILAFDFLLNMLLCFKIIRRYKKNNNHVDDIMMIDTHQLVLNEKLESMIPIGYCICFLMAYYGPNSAILIGIVDSNVEKTMKMMTIMFLIDIFSGIFSSILLWRFCKINIFKVYLHSQKEMWTIMTAQEAYLLYEVCDKLIVNKILYY